MRLDLYLSENKLTQTRTRARNLIELKRVTVNGEICTKVAYDVKTNDEIAIISDYASSLGSIKLEKAIEIFKPTVCGKTCLDLGAANGGFTDILLKNGAKKVFALDIGECALPDKLVNNEKVCVMERTNARYITKNNFPDNIEFITGDLSFISLTHILKPSFDLTEAGGEAIFLIKPQFELEKKYLNKKGIVQDKKLRDYAVKKIKEFAEEIGYKIKGITEAPHPFDDKNQEYFIYLIK